MYGDGPNGDGGGGQADLGVSFLTEGPAAPTSGL